MFNVIQPFSQMPKHQTRKSLFFAPPRPDGRMAGAANFSKKYVDRIACRSCSLFSEWKVYHKRQSTDAAWRPCYQDFTTKKQLFQYRVPQAFFFSNSFYSRFEVLRSVLSMFFSFQQFNVFLIYSAQFNWNFYHILSTPDLRCCVACWACCFIFSRNFEIISRNFEIISNVTY